MSSPLPSPFRTLRDLLLEALDDRPQSRALSAADRMSFVVEEPRDPSHGDAASNIALVLGKKLGVKPRELATQLAVRLKTRAAVAEAEAAGPGFLNIRFDPAFLRSLLRGVLRAGDDYGKLDLGAGRAVNVEYVSANPTGPLHIGHCRGAVVGDVLANLLAEAGFAPVREYYVNDAGAQIDKLAESVFLRYCELHGESVGAIPEGLYPGAYVIEAARELQTRCADRLQGRPREAWLQPARDAGVDAMMKMIRRDLETLGIRHDVFLSERSLYDPKNHRVDAAVAALNDAGLVYQGTPPPPKGGEKKSQGEASPRPSPLPLFRATAYGDDVDRPLRKSDGAYTYLASDAAYHYDKFLRGFTRQIDVLGADHGGYAARLKGVVSALSGGEATLEILICQMVRFLRDGKPARMSKRQGDFVLLRDIVDEIGADAVRFMMLFRRNDAPLDVDIGEWVERNRDNPVFYVQYAHARIRSVFRHASERLGGADADYRRSSLAQADMDLLVDADELALIRKVCAYPDMIEGAARACEPHRIAYYLHELAAAFHRLWTRGKVEIGMRFLEAGSRDLAMARLALLEAIRIALASGLRVIGIEPAEEMR